MAILVSSTTDPSTETKQNGTNTPEKPFDIAIAGGGIAGLILTIALTKQGIPVTLYESAKAFGEIGAGFGFGSNSVRAMELIDPALKRAFSDIAVTNIWENKKDTWFDFRIGDVRWATKLREEAQKKNGSNGSIGDVPRNVDDLVYSMPGSEGQGSAHRAHFLDQLIHLLPSNTEHFGKRLVDYSAMDNGRVKLHFADGTTAEHDALVGCDGIKSATRAVLLGKNDKAAHAEFTGKYCYRGLIPMDDAVAALGEEKAKNSQCYLGYGGHVLTYPIEEGGIVNVAAFNTTAPPWKYDKWLIKPNRESMFSDFEPWSTPETQSDPVPSILRLIQSSDTWAIFNYPSARTYFSASPPVCVLGDAAHASTPHQGAGAGMAVEDAYVLAELLGRVSRKEDIAHAFAAYDHARRPRTQRLVDTSREAGEMYDLEGIEGAIGDDPAAIKHNLSYRMKWIWNFDLKASLDEAIKDFKLRTGAS